MEAIDAGQTPSASPPPPPPAGEQSTPLRRAIPLPPPSPSKIHRHSSAKVSRGARGGRGGSPSAGARALSAIEELERQRRVSDAAHIRSSYRYLRQGLQPTPAFKRRESRYYRELESPSCSSSASRTPPPRRLNFGEGTSSHAPRVDDGEASSSRGTRPVPRFDPGDYDDDADIHKLAVELEQNTPVLTAGDFVPASILGTITALLEEKTRRDAEKAEEWRREQEAQDAKYIELSDSDGSE